MFHGGGEGKSSSVALVGKRKQSWTSSGCVNEIICRVCLLCSWVVWDDCQKRRNNMSREVGVVREGLNCPKTGFIFL